MGSTQVDGYTAHTLKNYGKRSTAPTAAASMSDAPLPVRLRRWIRLCVPHQSICNERPIDEPTEGRVSVPIEADDHHDWCHFYTVDHLGSVREMTDGTGNLQSEFSFDPYGRVTQVSGTGTTPDFQYAHYYVHQRSGLNLTRMRAYSSSLGRFISRDPIEEAGGVNLYDYVHNNPIGYSDPSGLSDEEGGGGLPAPTGGDKPTGNRLATCTTICTLGTIFVWIPSCLYTFQGNPQMMWWCIEKNTLVSVFWYCMFKCIGYGQTKSLPGGGSGGDGGTTGGGGGGGGGGDNGGGGDQGGAGHCRAGRKPPGWNPNGLPPIHNYGRLRRGALGLV